MKLSIGRLKNKLPILAYLALGICIGFTSLFLSFDKWLPILAGGLTILFILFFKKKVYWIIILLFLLLLGPVGAIRIGGKTPNIFCEDFYLLILIFLLVTIWLQKRKTKFIVSNYASWALAFLGVGFLSLLITPDLLRGVGFLKGYLTGFLALFLCLNVINRESDGRKVIYSLPLFGAIMAGWLYYNVSTTGTLSKAVVSIAWGHSNYLATFFVFLIPITIGLLFYKKNTLLIKFYLFASLVLMMIGLLTTQSKGALIAFSIALLVFLFKVFRKNKLKVVALIILLALIVTLHPATKVIFYKACDALHRHSLTGREIIYQGAIKTFLTHPIIGGGLGSFNHYMRKFVGPRTTYTTHNVILQTAAEMGILGLMALLALLIISYRNIIKLIKLNPEGSRTRLWAIGVLAGFIGHFIHALTESCFFGYQVWMIFWVVMALVYINLKLVDREKWTNTHSPS